MIMLPFGATKQLLDSMGREIAEWRACAKWDVQMDGVKPMGWDMSALERCRKKYCKVQK